MTALARALQLFDAYLDMAVEARTAALRALQRDEPDTYAELARLLAADDSLHLAGTSPHLLDSTPEALLARHGAGGDGTDPRLGTRLGAWRLQRVIGVGGMGTVYEAWRDDGQYTQRVAIKCIRAELSSARLLGSFRRERDILAGLDHPNIAALFDGGVDGDDQPWFAMRLVDGAPVDSWCDRHHKTLRARVQLLVDACDALGHAHRHMVLHQDIKPSNLLVTDDGQVQLLDFGLAASLATADHGPRIAASEGYTAPEAFSGEPPAVTLDVWSLGMVMYRLLCGALPPRSRLPLALDAEGSRRAVPRMSRRALTLDAGVAHSRGLRDLRALSRQLSGDLDAIVARCIAHDPALRYPSVAALREDLQRWLEHRPVAARGNGRCYRLRRFLGRNRAASVLAATAALALLAGGGAAAWQAQRAAREAASSMAVARVFEQTLGTATLSGLGDTRLSSQRLLEETEARIRSLSLQSHPRVLARGLAMLARNHAVLGDYTRAMTLAEEASQLQRDDPAARLATEATRASLLNLMGRHAQARLIATQALASLPGDHAPADRLQLMTEAARSHWDLGDHAQARDTLDAALALAATSGDPVPQAELLTLRGYWNLRQFRFGHASADLERAIGLALPHAPLVANAARQIAAQNLLQQERIVESRQVIEDLVADYRQRLGNDHPLTGGAWVVLANLQCSGGQLEACGQSLQEAERIVGERYGQEHPEYANVLRVQSLLSSFHGGTPLDSVAYLRRAEAIVSRFHPANHERVRRARAMLARRLLLAPAASPEQLRRNLDESIAMSESIHSAAGGLPITPIFTISMASALLERDGPGDRDRARQLLRDNREALARFPPAYSSHYYNEYMLAKLHLRSGEIDEAGEILQALVDPLRRYQESTNNRFTLGMVMTAQAAVALERGDATQARAWLVAAHEHASNAFGKTHRAFKQTRQRLDTFDRTGRITLPVE